MNKISKISEMFTNGYQDERRLKEYMKKNTSKIALPKVDSKKRRKNFAETLEVSMRQYIENPNIVKQSEEKERD